MKITFGDLFSGMSCPAFALKQNGVEFDYKFACDINEKCRSFLEKHHEPEKLYSDVTDIVELPHVNVMVMGFPCQPFSTSNTTVNTDDHKSKDLYKQCIRCINLAKPDTFIMENVRGLTFKSKKPYFDKVIEGLDSLVDYTYEYQVMNSLDYGTPQSRQRVWFIGRRNKNITWPDKCPLKYTLPDFIDFNMNSGFKSYTCKAKEGTPAHFKLQDGKYVSNAQNSGLFAKYSKWPIDTSHCVTTRHAPTLFLISNGEIFGRYYNKNELSKLFGLETVLGESNILTAHLLGNGMDVNLVGKLMVANL